MKKLLMASMGAFAIILAVNETANANTCIAGDLTVTADKFANHPNGGPKGLVGNKGILNSPATPGGDPLGETICSDAGNGNGIETRRLKLNGNTYIVEVDPGNSAPNNNDNSRETGNRNGCADVGTSPCPIDEVDFDNM